MSRFINWRNGHDAHQPHRGGMETCYKDYFRRMNGTKVTQFEGHLCELMWRWWDRRPKPEAILSLIREYYRLSGPPQFSASYPVFESCSRQPSNSRDDSLSRYDSSEDSSEGETETGAEAGVEPSTSSVEETEADSEQSAATSDIQLETPALSTITVKKTNRLSLKKRHYTVSTVNE